MANETKASEAKAAPTPAELVAKIENQAPIFVIPANSVLALQVRLTMAKAEKHGKDKGHFSVEYFCEEMLSDRLTSYSDYLDADEDRKNREGLVKAMNALPVPDMTDAAALKVYVTQVEGLQRKFRQGSYKPKSDK